MEITEQEFIDFKKIFVGLSVEHFKACNSFINSIKSTKSSLELANVLRNFDDEIYEKLGGSISLYEEKIMELEAENENLMCEFEDLHIKIEELSFKDGDLHDEMKYKIFLDYHSKYLPWEFEELLKNGNL
jgi:hypothetical protein